MRTIKLYLAVIATVCMLTATAEAQLPQINSISADTLTRSGRLRIFGTNFGSGGGTNQVLIDGHSAIITRWSSSQITAYVPELAGPGSVGVQVVTSGGVSNTLLLNVTLRQQQGRVRWAFEADVTDLWWRPALATDGTIYVHGSEGFVFALSPDGGLKWVANVNWYAYVPPAVGLDGTIYVGSIQRITALNPDGTQRWQFNDAGTQGVHSGPTIGPDGNIYFANDFGLGAYSLSPSGQLRWNNPGTPPISWYGGIGGETVLGPLAGGGVIDQMYVVPEPFFEDYTLQAFSLADGSLRFSVLIGGQDDPFGQQQTQPAVGPDGTVYVTHMRAFGGIGWVLEAYSPVDGHSLWYYHGNVNSGMTPPDVGPDGIVYYSQDISRIIAFNPNTLTPNWQYSDGTLMYHPTASPLNNMVITGGVITFGDVGFIKAISTGSGQLLWTVPLPGAFYPEPRVVSVHHPRFTPDGNTVYVSTTILAGNENDPHSFLYAIATGDTTIITTFQLTVAIENGWNMVSIPGLHPVDQNVNTWWAFRDLGANVFNYDVGYQSVATATPGLGYWMKHSGVRTYNTGDEWPASGIQIVAHAPLAGATGWNLIGGYELIVTAANVTTNPPGLQSGPIYKYSGGYSVATTLDPGYGYWIKLTGAGQIIIPETLAKDGKPVEYFPENWGRIIITDATGVNYTLYSVKGEVDLSQYELPPAPPSGMFDIRFGSGRIAEDLNSAIKTIEMNGVTYPLTVRVENMDIRLMDETGKTLNVNLKSGEDIVISDATISKLMVSGELIPAQYALEQNYPNPFNPSTVIEFSLPENVGNVKLSIYNALGEKVAELVNTALTAGKYQYQWNAQDVATGMYIYELRTDKFVSIKKMVLMK